MSTNTRPAAATGTILLQAVITHRGATLQVHDGFAAEVAKGYPNASATAMAQAGARLLFEQGQRLERRALNDMRKNQLNGGFNIAPGARLTSDQDSVIATVQWLIPEGATEPKWQIVPGGGADRMPMPQWNHLIGQQMCEAAFAHLSAILGIAEQIHLEGEVEVTPAVEQG